MSNRRIWPIALVVLGEGSWLSVGCLLDEPSSALLMTLPMAVVSPRKLIFAVWGVWLYVAVAAAAAVLETFTLILERGPSDGQLERSRADEHQSHHPFQVQPIVGLRFRRTGA